MLIDEVSKITVKSGNGGNGRVSFYKYRRGPDGGTGGKGGDVYFAAVNDITALNKFSIKKKFHAENGENGKANQAKGRGGKDLTIAFPIGTFLTDLETGEETEIKTANDNFLVCRGGRAGKGNYELRSSTNTTPKFAQEGEIGEKREFKVVLKLIANFGFIGLPNAGKSSLLNELTAAHAKVAHYPFTTLEPNLGTLENGKVIADLPGLIEGASGGKGLGVRFLKHIEKVKVILHCLSLESENPEKDYLVIRKELGEYNKKLLRKKEIILLTKSDLIDEREKMKKKKKLAKFKKPILFVSVYNFDEIESLKKLLLIK